MSNKSLGNSFEVEFSKLLYQKGFWVHIMASKSAGQPADIIAVKNRHSFLIDAKVCSDNVFDTTRVEENQKNSMNLWDECGNGPCYFPLKMKDGTIRMLDHYTALLHRQSHRTLNRQEILSCTYSLQEWLKRVMT